MGELVGAFGVPHHPNFPALAAEDTSFARSLRRLYGEVEQRLASVEPDVLLIFSAPRTDRRSHRIRRVTVRSPNCHLRDASSAVSMPVTLVLRGSTALVGNGWRVDRGLL